MLKIYQHDWRAEMYPVTCSGSKKFKPSMFDNYEHVATVETDNLEEAFRLGNDVPGLNDGNEWKLTKHRRMYSVSVGDILIDERGDKHMVDGVGFRQVYTEPVVYLWSKLLDAVRPTTLI
jgi:hypothetical protein